MRLESLKIRQLKCFKAVNLDLSNRSKELPNIQVLLGENGTGKSAILQAIALAVLNESLRDSGLFLNAMTRRSAGQSSGKNRNGNQAEMTAKVVTNDNGANSTITLQTTLESVSSGRDRFGKHSTSHREALNQLLNEDDRRSFFLVGYGAGRQASPGAEYRFGVHDSQYGMRFQRVGSLFRNDFALIPLSAWYPELSSAGKEAVNSILNQLLGDRLQLTDQTENGELLINESGIFLPVDALSDGYRSFLAWVSDLLWRLFDAAGDNVTITDVEGMVLVDEIDLHLHPAWQRQVLQSLTKALPNLQFIVTTHSPLIVGGVYQENIHVLRKDNGIGSLARADRSPFGLSVDQILVSPFFGLSGTRSEKFESRIDEVRQRAIAGDVDAFMRLTSMMTDGEAGDQEPENPTGKKLSMKRARNYLHGES